MYHLVNFIFLLHAHKLSHERIDGFEVENTLGSDKGFQTNRGSNPGLTNHTSTQQKYASPDHQKGNGCDEIDSEFVLPPIVQKVELNLEEDWKDWLQHPRNNSSVVAVFKFGCAILPSNLGGRVETSDDNIRSESRKTLNGSRSNLSASRITFKLSLDLGSARSTFEFLGDDEGILDRLATSLAQIGHHGVDTVTQKSHMILCPRLGNARRSIVQITLLDLVFLRHCQNGMNFWGPHLEKILKVFGGSFRLGIVHGTWRTSQECVPLISSVSDIGNDKVLLGSNVDLVTNLAIVGGGIIQLTGKHRISRVGSPRVISLSRSSVHLRSDRRPNSICSNQDVSRNGFPRIQFRSDTSSGAIGCVRHNTISVLDGSLFEIVEIDFLKVRSFDDSCVWHATCLGWGSKIEFGVPFGSDAVFDTVFFITCEGKFFHDFVVHF
mmetsp:Transcript_18600/g.46141  ORF Transcript_18600/g.46141 Transcript_18600/m.46141 type:complete len:437 (-) Transcript_18600:614-1924(-)